MKGRIKGNNDRLLIQAHYNEAMARQANLKPIEHYLNPPEKPKDGGVSLIKAFFERAIERSKRNGE